MAKTVQAPLKVLNTNIIPVASRDNQPFTVAVEGNIGAGKSTLLTYFRNDPLVDLHEEPLESWLNVGGKNLLDLMYHDTPRWGFTFQSFVHLTRIRQYSAPCSKPLRFMERSFLSNRYCFTEHWKQNNDISDVETSLLTSWQDQIRDEIVPPTTIDLLIYLRLPPDVAYQRLKKRGRTEEDVVPISLLESIHGLHEDWLIERNPTKVVPCPVVVIDSSKTLEDLDGMYKQLREDLKAISRSTSGL